MNERPETGWRTDPHLRRTRTILLNTGDPEGKRSEILQYFHDTYDIDESLFEVLKYDETFYRRADPLRHPLIFYFGHTAAFYINKLILAKLIERRLNPTYESLFAVGVDEMSWDDLNEEHYDWPRVAELQAYRDRVRAVGRSSWRCESDRLSTSSSAAIRKAVPRWHRSPSPVLPRRPRS